MSIQEKMNLEEVERFLTESKFTNIHTEEEWIFEKLDEEIRPENILVNGTLFIDNNTGIRYILLQERDDLKDTNVFSFLVQDEEEAEKLFGDYSVTLEIDQNRTITLIGTEPVHLRISE